MSMLWDNRLELLLAMAPRFVVIDETLEVRVFAVPKYASVDI